MLGPGQLGRGVPEDALDLLSKEQGKTRGRLSDLKQKYISIHSSQVLRCQVAGGVSRCTYTNLLLYYVCT